MILLPLLASVVLLCQPPTTSTDNSPVKTPLTFKFFMGLTSGAYPNVSPVQPTCGYAWPALTPNTYRFVAVAVDATGAQSVISNEATKVVAAGVTTVGGPVFSIQTTTNAMVNPQLGTIVAGKPCDATTGAIFGSKTYLRVTIADAALFAGVDTAGLLLVASCQ